MFGSALDVSQWHLLVTEPARAGAGRLATRAPLYLYDIDSEQVAHHDTMYKAGGEKSPECDTNAV